MMSNDHIPKKDSDFNNWFKNLCQYVTVKTSVIPPATAPEWTHIPAGEVTLLNNAYAAWYTVYVIVLKPHTPADTLAKDEARAAAEEVIRPFIGQWLMWKQVSDVEREEMGIHNRNPRRPEIPPPSTVPELTISTGVPRQLLIAYRDKGSARRGKPADVHGIEVRWAFLAAPPQDIEKDLTQSSFDTKSPLTLNFEEYDRGKRIYLAGRWEINREGIKGEFGDIESAIVP
jgi:hypothetical protein